MNSIVGAMIAHKGGPGGVARKVVLQQRKLAMGRLVHPGSMARPQGLEVRRERIRELIFDFYWNSKHSREAIEAFLITVLDEAFSEPPSDAMLRIGIAKGAAGEYNEGIYAAMAAAKRKEWE